MLLAVVLLYNIQLNIICLFIHITRNFRLTHLYDEICAVMGLVNLCYNIMYCCRPLPKEEIVSRASSKLGKKTYDLMTNNCEHFATWCRYKKQVSRQADAITKSEGAIYEMLRKMIKTEKN